MHKKNGQIEIPLAGLSEGSHEFDFTCNASFFNDPHLVEAGFTRDIEVRVVAEKREHEVILEIETSTVAVLSCDICLLPVSKPLAGSFRIYYTFGELPEEDQEGSEEYRILDRSALAIDITEDVRELLFLSRPMKVTCTNNAECRLPYGEKEDEGVQPEESNSWLDSLEKLKNKYR